MELVSRLRRFYSAAPHKRASSAAEHREVCESDVEPAEDALGHATYSHGGGTFAWLNRRRSSLQQHLHHAWRRRSHDEEAASCSEDESARSQKNSVLRERIRAAVNNVKYGWSWKHAAHFDGELPLWLLGRMYHSRKFDVCDDIARLSLAPGLDEADLADFYAAFSSRIWLTYRSGMSPMVKNGSDTTDGPMKGEVLTTDCGWGCMLRSAQMLAAQALMLHLLGTTWTMHGAQSESEQRAHRRIIAYFGDAPSCALSVHCLVAQAKRYGNSVGQWYGPASAALLVRDAFRAAAAYGDPILSQIRVHAARDCTISLQEIDELCCPSSPSNPAENDDVPQEWDSSLFLIVPLRLGADKLNMLYASHISCCGIMGGRPSHSMYFVGWHDRSLIYLDPHFCQDTIDTELPNFDTSVRLSWWKRLWGIVYDDTYHCHWPRKLKFSDMDPSIAVGFYFRNRTSWISFLDHVKHIVEVEGSSVNLKHALFSVVRRTPSWRERERSGDVQSGGCDSPQSGSRSAASGPSSRRASAVRHGFELL